MARHARDLAEAVAELARRPSQAIRTRVGELEVELRVVSGQVEPGLGDRMAAIGPWVGESTDEILRIVREGREHGGSAEPPEI